VCETAKAVAAGSADGLEASQAVVLWESLNLRNIFNTSAFCYRPDTAQHPLWSFISRCGACDEYSTLFSRMMGCLGIESRMARDPAENHNWAEVLVGGEWLVVDPVANLVGIDAGAYENELGSNISYVVGRYNNGTEVDLTLRYTNTGRLVISITDYDAAASYGIFISAIHGADERPTNAKCEINSSGSCSVALGGNSYAVGAVKYGILPLFDERRVELKEGETAIVSLSPSDFDMAKALGLLPKRLVVVLLILLLSLLVWFAAVSAIFLLKNI
jgi:hypothetical protein